MRFDVYRIHLNQSLFFRKFIKLWVEIWKLLHKAEGWPETMGLGKGTASVGSAVPELRLKAQTSVPAPGEWRGM